MDIYKFRELLERYEDGQATDEEKALVEAWYKSYAADERELTDLDTTGSHGAIRSKLNLTPAKKRIIALSVLRIAASIILAASAGLFIWQNFKKEKPAVYLTFETGVRSMKKIMLPDSSTVWLNADTKIKVPESFDGKTRTVILECGEAFFDVRHDADHPFIVKVSELAVQVYGTSFNVRNYKELGHVTVAVATGKVGVTKKGKVLSMLLPDDQLNYITNTGTFTNERVITNQVQSWKSGYTYLSDVDFKELSVVVKNLFGLSFKTSSPKIVAYHFTCRLNHNINSQQLLNMIGELHDTHYRKEGNDIVLY